MPPGHSIGKVYDLVDHAKGYEAEEVYRSKTEGDEFLIYLKDRFTEPKVIILESSIEEKESTVRYEKAKT